MSDKTQTTGTREYSKPTLLPKLRFPEFQHADGWKKESLAKICGRITNGKANAQDHEDGGEYPLFDRSAVVKRSGAYTFDGEAVILPGEGVRFTPKFFRGKFNLHQRAYVLMEHSGDARFVYHSLHFLQDLLAEKAVKSTVLSLRLPIVEKFVIGYPEIPEQQRIAECLSAVDEVIAVQARKVDALKTYKKGLMQLIFPREDETQPHLRLSEFRGKEEWERKPLGQVIEIASGQVDPTKPPYCDWPQIGSDNMEASAGKLVNVKSAADKGVMSGNYAFDESDILYSKIRPALNKVAAPTFKGICSADIYPIRPANRGLLRSYLLYLLLSQEFLDYAIRNSERGKIPKINRDTLRTFVAPIPSIAEQQRIAGCLSSLDALITAAVEMLEALKRHKRGLMQQLFPSRDEVEA